MHGLDDLHEAENRFEPAGFTLPRHLLILAGDGHQQLLVAMHRFVVRLIMAEIGRDDHENRTSASQCFGEKKGKLVQVGFLVKKHGHNGKARAETLLQERKFHLQAMLGRMCQIVDMATPLPARSSTRSTATGTLPSGVTNADALLRPTPCTA